MEDLCQIRCLSESPCLRCTYPQWPMGNRTCDTWDVLMTMARKDRMDDYGWLWMTMDDLRKQNLEPFHHWYESVTNDDSIITIMNHHSYWVLLLSQDSITYIPHHPSQQGITEQPRPWTCDWHEPTSSRIARSLDPSDPAAGVQTMQKTNLAPQRNVAKKHIMSNEWGK